MYIMQQVHAYAFTVSLPHLETVLLSDKINVILKYEVR